MRRQLSCRMGQLGFLLEPSRDRTVQELEEQLKDADFFRANKSCIINFRHIASLKSELNRRLLVTMTNGEKLIVSRQYAEYVKEKLEVR